MLCVYYKFTVLNSVELPLFAGGRSRISKGRQSDRAAPSSAGIYVLTSWDQDVCVCVCVSIYIYILYVWSGKLSCLLPLLSPPLFPPLPSSTPPLRYYGSCGGRESAASLPHSLITCCSDVWCTRQLSRTNLSAFLCLTSRVNSNGICRFGSLIIINSGYIWLLKP